MYVCVVVSDDKVKDSKGAVEIEVSAGFSLQMICAYAFLLH